MCVYVTMVKTVVFCGKKSKCHFALVLKEVFQKSPCWRIKEGVPCQSDVVVLVALSGVPQSLQMTRQGIRRNALCMDQNPWGLTSYNGNNNENMVFMFNLDSFVFTLSRPIDIWMPDRWERFAAKYNMPTPKEWRRVNKGPVVILLPNRGGWIYKSNTWTTVVKDVIKRVRNAVNCDIVLRPHPKNKRLDILGILNERHARIQREPIHEVAPTVRAVVTLWGCAFVQFVIYGGTPVFDLSPESRTSANAVSDRNASHLADMSQYAPSIERPRDFLNLLSQRVFDKSDYDNGDFVNFVDRHTL